MQIKSATDLSPITVVVGAASTAKGAAVFFYKNGNPTQSQGITGVPALKTFNPESVSPGDTVEIRIT